MLDANIQISVATQWTREGVIQQRREAGYELVGEEKVTTRKVALVFKKVEEELMAPTDFIRRRPVKASTNPQPLNVFAGDVSFAGLNTAQANLPKPIFTKEHEELVAYILEDTPQHAKLFETNTDEDK